MVYCGRLLKHSGFSFLLVDTNTYMVRIVRCFAKHFGSY
ncbi:hypothetical protein X975_10388, partial [Stegodyphus mimosarum]